MSEQESQALACCRTLPSSHLPGTSAHWADGCGSCTGPPASLVFWELLRIPRGAREDGWSAGHVPTHSVFWASG